ncbi:MAG: sigma-70 family RNA polymerase sigma factor [Planctomycetaceae bacterium]|nr:sigma-70 family RNA polymerase sigma factor [Planctomycetaceae bacterium]
MDKSEEIALVARLVAGDEEAWGTFCHEYSADLLAIVQYGLGGNRETAEEIVQRTFVRCVRSINTFDPARGRLFPWLKQVAGNEARSLFRHRECASGEVPLSAIPQHVVESLADAVDRTPLPDELVESAETQVLIRECLAELNSRYRQALIQKYVEGRTVAAIAAELNVSVKAAESILSRAREAFKRVVLARLTPSYMQRTEILE